MTLAKLQKLYAAGARILVVKSSMGFGDDPKVVERVSWGQQLGFVTGIYHWIDPTNTAQAQVDRFSKWIKQLNPDFGSGDHEQWWADWDKYEAWQGSKIANSDVPQLVANQIDSVARSFMAGIKASFPKFFNFIYTGQWFDEHDPSMQSWIGQYPGWFASGDKYNGPHQYTSWDPFYDYLNKLSSYNPLLPQGATKCTLLQFTGAAHLPGVDGTMDVNYFNGTEQQFRDLVHSEIIINPPPATTTYLVTSPSGVYIREAADASSPKVKWVANGTQVSVIQILPNQWALTPDGYIFSSYLTPKETKPVPAIPVLHYRVSNASGTYIQSAPNWSSAAIRYVQNGTDLYVNASYDEAPGWLQLQYGGYVAASRVTQVAS
jgi:GH25 family lysozyme M1 (1,4-beta-N-acetylmuramidase)